MTAKHKFSFAERSGSSLSCKSFPVQTARHHLFLSATLVFLCLSVLGQQAQPWKDQKWPTKCKEDTVYFNMPELLKRNESLKQRFRMFANFMDKKGMRLGALPFAPAIAIDPRCVFDTNQVWIGMQKQGNTNRYILILLPTGRSEMYNDYMATNNFIKASKEAKECTIIVLNYLKGDKNGQTAAYYTVPAQGITGLSKYIQNFETHLRELKLEKDFPYTFKFTPRRLHQVVKTYILAVSHTSRNTTKIHQSGTYILHASTKAAPADDNYVELEAIDGEVCCQSPPRS